MGWRGKRKSRNGLICVPGTGCSVRALFDSKHAADTSLKDNFEGAAQNARIAGGGDSAEVA
jgi:hypothetical protein